MSAPITEILLPRRSTEMVRICVYRPQQHSALLGPHGRPLRGPAAVNQFPRFMSNSLGFAKKLFGVLKSGVDHHNFHQHWPGVMRQTQPVTHVRPSDETLSRDDMINM